MDRPQLPPVPADRSALPALRTLERELARQQEGARAEIAARLEAERAEAQALRAAGEAELRDALLAAERAALRDVETRARDRVNAARGDVSRWVDRVEQDLGPTIAEAVRMLTRAPGG
jgi:predicted phage gp36 major capsid-like protein